MHTIAASILSADRLHLPEETRAAVVAGVDAIHLNVIGSEDRPNLTLGHIVCASLRPHCSVPLHAHLHVPAVDGLIEAFAEAGADLITVHASGAATRATLQRIRRGGCRAGLAFDPTEALDPLAALLDDIDLVHLSCAAPAPAPRHFMPSMLRKLEQARRLIDAAGRAVPLQADGDLHAGNIRSVADAGATGFVVGRALFGASDRAAALAELRARLAAATEPRPRLAAGTQPSAAA